MNPPDESIIRLSFPQDLVDEWMRLRDRRDAPADCLTIDELQHLRFQAWRLRRQGERRLRERQC